MFDDIPLVAELLVVAHQRHHDFHLDRNAAFFDVHGRLDDGACLHLGDFRIGVAQAASAVAEHRVHFVERIDARLDFVVADIHLRCHFALALLVLRNEFVQRRVEQADGDGIAVHHLEERFEVAALHRQQLGERHAAAGFVIGENHLAHGLDTGIFEKHVFRAAETDTLRTERECRPGVAGGVGVGAYPHYRILLGQVEEFGEIVVEFGGLGRYLAEIDFARRAVQGNPVALPDEGVAYADGPGFIVYDELSGTRYAAFAHAAGHYGRVRGHASAGRQDTLRRIHAAEVFGRGFDAHEDDFPAVAVPLGGVLGEKDHFAGRCAGRGGKTLGEYLGIFHRRGVEYGMEQFVQFGRFASEYGRLFVDEPFGEHVHRYLEHGRAGTFAVTRLEHPQFAVLYGELEVLHVGEVALQMLLYVEQLLVGGGHRLLQGGVFGLALLFAYPLCGGPAARTFEGYLLRGADTGHDILSLCVDEVFAVEDVFAGRCVAGEGYAGRRPVAHVPEDHRLYVDCGTPFGRDVVEFAVENGAFVHPALEHGHDGAPELLPRVGGEIGSRALLDGRLELHDQFPEVVGGELRVEPDAALLLHLVDDDLERVFVLFALRFHAEHHVAVHLYETAVGVPCETVVARTLGKCLHGGVIEPEVQNGIHHARHGGTGSRTYRDQQRHGVAAERHARLFLYAFNRFLHFGTYHFDHGVASLLVIFRTYFGGDGESGGDGDSHEVHLRQVGAFAAEQFPHLAVAFGLLVAERVDSLDC